MNAFKDRLGQGPLDTSSPTLAHQSLGREMTPAERDLAAALIDLYGGGTHDFDAVAAGLTARGVRAPLSGKTDWDVELLRAELVAINTDLDAAYRENGRGA